MIHADAIVIGAGFGGLGAALELARQGVHVVVFEALAYPGGCASTFEKGGVRYEAGATMFSGFAPGQLFHRWIREHDLDVDIHLLDPVARFHAPGLDLVVPADRQAFVDQLCALPGAPDPAIRQFFAHQASISDTLWDLFDDPTLLPPLSASSLLSHLGRSPRYLPLLPLVGQPLATDLRRFGLEDFAPLRTWIDAVCQITVQLPADQAEAPFALAALDYFWRGAAHVRGGIGRLADAMVSAIERYGGEVRFTDRVRGLERRDDRWVVTSRKGEARAPTVIANLLPQTVRKMTGTDTRRLRRLSRELEDGWSAAMLYLTVEDSEDLPDQPTHVQIVGDPTAPFREGNHVLASLGEPQELDGRMVRAATVSTHVSGAGYADQGRRIRQIQDRMGDLIRATLPEWQIAGELPASPRTFARFTRRPDGLVGGIPRRAGLGSYRDLLAGPLLKDLYLVGDTVFPGQSTLATAVGGHRVATRVAGRRAA